MRRARLFSRLAVLLAAGALGLGYGLTGFMPGVLVAVAIGALWLLLAWGFRGWPASFGLAALLVFAAIGSYVDVPPLWLLLSATAGLAAWDLEHFLHRAGALPQAEGGADLENAHLARLTWVAGLGFVLGLLALALRLQLSFFWALLLGLLLLVALAQAIGFLRRESD